MVGGRWPIVVLVGSLVHTQEKKNNEEKKKTHYYYYSCIYMELKLKSFSQTMVVTTLVVAGKKGLRRYLLSSASISLRIVVSTSYSLHYFKIIIIMRNTYLLAF